MPILGGYFVDNQKTIYESMAARKLLIQGGDFTGYTIEDFKDRIQGILEDKGTHAFMARQKSLFDGRSNKRIAGLINTMTLRFRRAMKKDLAITFEWSNDVLVRSNSFDSEPISLEQHTKWFLGKLANNATLFLIALVNDTPAGVVRYELNEEHAVIGISISKNYRGQNLAHAMLRKSASLYFETNSLSILAYIKEENLASEKSFKKAGYTYLKTEEVKGIKSNIYKLEYKNEI
jgi:RimJ/RimL family protein N-acetyltransferase